MFMAHACGFNAVPVCTAYDSLGPDGLTHSLNETEVRSMWTNADLLPTLAKVIGQCPTVKLIIYDGKPDQKLLDQLTGAREGMKVMPLDEVVQLGRQKPVEPRKAKKEDTMLCMYTSGSSKYSNPSHIHKKADWSVVGTPKGVILTHGNILAASTSTLFVKVIAHRLQSVQYGHYCTNT